MRVLLFVSGPRGPRCIKHASSWTYDGDVLRTAPPLSERVLAAVRSARRWWLVQCSTAADGRVLCLNAEWGAAGLVHVGGNKLGRVEQHPNAQSPPGRILASGGRDA